MPHEPRPTLHHPPLEDISVTEVFAALGDATRLSIVQTLLLEPDGRACGTFPVSVAASTLSHHFKVLRAAGLIHQEDRGTKRWTTLRTEQLEQKFPAVLSALRDSVSASIPVL